MSACDEDAGTVRRDIPKSQRQRLEELRQALVVIERGLEAAFETGEAAHFLPVLGQLRSLLASGNQTPLLLDLAQKLGFPLEFYSTPLDSLDNAEIAEILGPARIQWTGDSLSPKAEPPFSQKVTMKDWLASTQAVVGERKISGEQLLKMVANKLGASHYDPTLPPELAAMAPFSLAGVPSFYLTLARLGEVVVHLGRTLLETRRVEAAQEIARMEVEDVPDPETLSRQLEGTYESSPETESPA